MTDAGRPRALVLAFSCSPYRGSEAASAWGAVRAIDDVADVTVLTRMSNVAEIERWGRAHGDAVRYVGVAGGRVGRSGHRNPLLHIALWRLFYVGWLRRAARVAAALHAEEPFDVAVHSSLGIWWLPSPVVDLGVGSVWGPTSGATASPVALYPYLGVRGVARELAEVAIARAVSRWPATRRTWRDADVLLVESEATRSRLPRRDRARARVVYGSALCSAGPVPPRPRQPVVVFLSALEDHKAPRLAVDALARTPDPVRLVFLHEGPQEAALRERAARLGVADRVEFRGRVTRGEMAETLGGAAAAVFTGVREEGGAALAEAMRAGTPVVVLATDGVRGLAAQTTDPDRVALIAPATPARTAQGLADAMADFCLRPRARRDGHLDDRANRSALQQAVLAAAGRTSPSGSAGRRRAPRAVAAVGGVLRS